MYRLQKKPIAHKEVIQHLNMNFLIICLDSDTDPYSIYGSGYGSNIPIEYGYKSGSGYGLDPDPEPCNSGD
jgi:hypothetical protein